MTAEDLKQELDREPFVPLRLHVASGQKVEVSYPNTAWVRWNTLLVVHPLARGTHAIGNYDVVALRLIERIEQIGSGNGSGAAGPGRRAAVGSSPAVSLPGS